MDPLRPLKIALVLPALAEADLAVARELPAIVSSTAPEFCYAAHPAAEFGWTET